MFTRRHFGTLVASLVANAAGGVPTAMPRPARGSLSRGTLLEIPRMLDIARVPALTYALIENGRISESSAVGVAKIGGRPVSSSTYFDAASLTKPIFATIALALAKSGTLDMDRPLQDYQPLFEDPLSQTITARHVLSHSTGLPNWHFSLKEPIKSEFKPGTRWSYSGEAYFLLLSVVEHLTQLTFAQLTEKFVFGPAGMHRSSVVWTDGVAANNAWPHDNVGEPMDDKLLTQRQSAARYDYAQKTGVPMDRWMTSDSLRACEANSEKPVPGNALPNPAFGLWTTAEDYAHFLLYASQDPRRAEVVAPMRGRLGWGLGWGLESSTEGKYAWHWGDGSGVKNLFMLHLPSQTGLVIFTNGENGLRVYRRLTRTCFSREFDAFLWV
jgi:CubicO group peptidase (beta-lactamase class C family)